MPPRALTQDETQELLNRRDLFKLTIRGHATLEATVDSFLDLLFVGGRDEYRGLTFTRKHRLLVALGVLPADVSSALGQFSAIRNRLAHGEYDEPPWKAVRDAAFAASAAYPGRQNGPPIETMLTDGTALPFALAVVIMTLDGAVQSYRDGYYAQRVREVHSVATVDPRDELLRRIRSPKSDGSP